MGWSMINAQAVIPQTLTDTNSAIYREAALSAVRTRQVFGKNGVRSWLDAAADKSNWFKLVRCATSPHEVNLQHEKFAGQVWYKVTRDVSAGQELLVGAWTSLPLQDVLTTGVVYTSHSGGSLLRSKGWSVGSSTVESQFMLR
ncbi:transcription factor hamlet like protein [Danaus plexippus plexippus]|uniref:Transcription factor hamlet like protein n=1 Tax=Danaus plexippus plexippus TaxID=278856 RepID=A0A212EXD0_DANPL|nr:transcription factor hamlet like protein [Danaus plexippus plexippus]